MTKTSLSLIACIAALLSGCAEMDWTKAGADGDTTARDMSECRARALGNTPPPTANVTQNRQMVDRGGAPAVTRSGSANDRFMAEHEEVRRCMAARGYQLGPAR